MIKEIESNIKLKTYKYGCDNILDDIKEKYPFLVPHTHFFYYIIGKSGSGKSTLLMNISCNFYRKKFNRIFLVSPSFATLEENPFLENLPTDQLYPDLTEEVIDEITERIKDTGEKVLLILDDVQDKIKGSIETKIKRLINNRRHICGVDEEDNKGNLSIIITSQVYNNLALSCRKSADICFMFGTKNSKEVKAIQEEFLSSIPKEVLTDIWDYVYTKPHNFLVIKNNVAFEDMLYKNFNKLIIDL